MKVKPRYRGRAHASGADSSLEVSGLIPPNVDNIGCQEFIDYYKIHDVHHIQTKTSLMEWIPVLDRLDDFLSDRNLPSTHTKEILLFLNFLLTKAQDIRVFNSTEHLVSLLWHPDPLVILQDLHCITSLLKNPTTRISSRFISPLRSRLQFLATGLIASTSISLKKMYLSVEIPQGKPITISGPGLDSSAIIDFKDLGDHPFETASAFFSKYQCSELCQFQINHRISLSLGSECNRRTYCHIILRSLEAGVLLPSNNFQLSGVANVCQDVVGLVEDCDCLPLDSFDDDIIIVALHTLQILASYDIYRRKLIEANIFEENGVILNGYLLLADEVRSKVGLSPDDHLSFKRFCSYSALMSELSLAHGSSSIAESASRADRLSVIGVAVDEDVIIRSMISILNCSYMCPFHVISSICTFLINLLLNNAAARSAFLDQNALGPIFSQLSLALEFSPNSDSIRNDFHNAIQLLLRVVLIILQRTRATISQQVLPDVAFVRLMTHLWETCIIGPTSVSAQVGQSRSSSAVDIRTLLMTTSDPPSSVSSPSRTPAHLSSTSSSDTSTLRLAFNPTESGLLIFTTACNIVSRFIQNRPRSLQTLHREGITSSYLHWFPFVLESVAKCKAEYRESMIKILLDLIRSLSIHSAGLSAVLAADPVRRVLQLFESPDMFDYFSSSPSAVQSVGRSVDEWIRHYPDFEEPVIAAVINALTRLQDGPGALIFADVHDRTTASSSPSLEQVYDQAIVNISSFIKCVVQRHIAKFCALNGPSQLCAFATSPGSSYRIHGIGRAADTNESSPLFVLPNHPKLPSFGGLFDLVAGKLTTSSDALSECYAWIAVQQARLPIDVLFDRLQKFCDTVIRSEAFQSSTFLWPFDELKSSQRCDQAYDQAVIVSSVHFFVSTLWRIVHRSPSFQMRQAQITSLFTTLSKIVAKVEWALSGLEFDSILDVECFPQDLSARSLISNMLDPFKFVLTQFITTVHGLMIALAVRGSSRLLENNVFTSIVVSHAVQMINFKPLRVSVNFIDLLVSWPDSSRQDDPSSTNEQKSLLSSWCSLLLYTSKVFAKARESIFRRRSSDSLSTQETASMVLALNELLNSGGIARLVELWNWVIEVRPQDLREVSNPWGSPLDAVRSTNKKSRKIRNQSDAATSSSNWQWPAMLDSSLMNSLDALFVELSRFTVVLSTLPEAVYLGIHDRFHILAASLFEDIWKSPTSFPFPVVLAMLQSSYAFSVCHANKGRTSQGIRAPMVSSDTDEEHYEDEEDDDRSHHAMVDDDGSPAAADRDSSEDETRTLFVNQLSEMGFSEQHILWALDRSSIRNFNAFVEWMFEHPYFENPDPASVSDSSSVNALSNTAAAHSLSDSQPVPPESAAHAAVEAKFRSVAIPDVNCLSVGRAMQSIPILISLSKSFLPPEKDDRSLIEYGNELAHYILRVISACHNDVQLINEFTLHVTCEMASVLHSCDLLVPGHARVAFTVLSVCFQIVSNSKPFARSLSECKNFMQAVLYISNQMAALVDMCPFLTRLAVSVSGLFTWCCSIWCTDNDTSFPKLCVSLNLRLQMARACIHLLSSPISCDIEASHGLLMCLTTLLSQCDVIEAENFITSVLLLKRQFKLGSIKTFALLVDNILHLLLEDSSLINSSIQKFLRSLLESSSDSEVNLSQVFDRNRSMILRSIDGVANMIVQSYHIDSKTPSSHSGLASLVLHQKQLQSSSHCERSVWRNVLSEIMDQITFLAWNDSGASLSGSFTSSLCDPIRLLYAVRTIAHTHSPYLHQFIVEYVGPAQTVQHRFIEVLVFKLLTIRGSNLRTSECNAEMSTTFAKDLRRAAQVTLIELCIADDKFAIPVFECLRDAICRDVGDDRSVARYATAVLSLLRNSPNERDRACLMIELGMIPTLVNALESLNLKGPQFSECCDGILRTLEAFGSLDLTSALIRVRQDPSISVDQNETQMDIVEGFIDFPHNDSHASSTQHANTAITDSIQEMEEEEEDRQQVELEQNTNHDQAGVADHELALAEQEDNDDEDGVDVDDGIIATTDFIRGLSNLGTSVSDEYEESEYDEDDVDNAMHPDHDEEDENDNEDEEELAAAELPPASLNFRSSSSRGLHAFSHRIFPHQFVQLRRPVIDIGINFAEVAALNHNEQRLRHVLDDFQTTIDSSDIDILVSNSAASVNRQEDSNVRRRLSTSSHRNIVVRASRHPDDELPWLSENFNIARAPASRAHMPRRNTVPVDGQRLGDIVSDANARIENHLHNRPLASNPLSNSSWASRMMDVSGPLIKETLSVFFHSLFVRQQVEREHLPSPGLSTILPAPNGADETDSVASTNVAVSVASASAVGPTEALMNTSELEPPTTFEELEQNDNVSSVPAGSNEFEEHVPHQDSSTSVEADVSNSSPQVGLSEEERLAFLAALPPELQAEILLQDSRHQAANANPEAINPAMIADIDSASFIATLPQDIREEFLMNQDDNFLSSLPPELMAEAVLLRQRNVYSERDEFPPSIRRRGQQQPRPPTVSSTVESASPTSPVSPLLPIRLVIPLLGLLKVRNFDCLATVQRVVRVMAHFISTRESVLKVLYSICVASTSPRSPCSTKKLPSYLLIRALSTLRFLLKSSCRDEVLLWFLYPNDSAPVHNVFLLISSSRLDMSETIMLSLFGFLDDVLVIFKDVSGHSAQVKELDVCVPSISPGVISSIIAISISKVCTNRISDMIMSLISILAKSPANRLIIISELTQSLNALRTALDPLSLTSRKSGAVALFQSSILRQLNLLKAVVPDIQVLDQESNDSILECITGLSSLWLELHKLLCSIQLSGSTSVSSPPGDNFNTIALEKSLQYKPFIEAMFVQRKIADTPTCKRDFQTFCQSHRRVLNFLCSRYPKLLSGSLSELITMRSGNILDFENKRKYFHSQLESKFSSFRSRYRSVKLQIRRSRLFEDSYHQLRNQTLNELRSHMTVHFMGEEGMDAGGLTREWFLIMSREIFNPNYALFRNAADSQVVFQPNKFSYWNPEHIDFFRFVGRFVGKAIYQGCLLDAYFTRSFYKHMLGIKPSFSDMESIDPDFYKSLKWMLANPIKGVLDLAFSAETHEFGERRVFSLKPNGHNIPVTDENKHEYVTLITELRTTTEIKAQIDSFVSGFHELIPKELVSVFNDHDLELLICGLPEIDINDLRANTEYHGLSETSDVIQWFWAALQSFTSEEKALFIQFVTGTSKVPIGGFRALQGMSGVQRFQIHRGTGIDRLPSTHTCFNQLDLPDYSSPESLVDKLRLAISEGATGFGFA